MPTPLRRLLPAALLLAACAPGERVAAPRTPAFAPALHGSPDRSGVGRTRLALERAADGLLYTSESDHPFTYVRRPTPGVPIHGDLPADVDLHLFRAAFGIPADTPVEVVTLDAFLARHIERVDPADPVATALVPRYVRLRETLRERLHDVRVYRVGTVAIDCYAVGYDGSGQLVGLHTIAVET